MAHVALSAEDIATGRAVLLATDALAMEAEGAFWLVDKKDGERRFFLVTSLIDRIGPRTIYLRLEKALGAILSEGETKGLALFLLSPRDRLVGALRNQIATTRHSSWPSLVTVKELDNAVACVYRLADPLDDRKTRLAQRRFRLRCSELRAA